MLCDVTTPRDECLRHTLQCVTLCERQRSAPLLLPPRQPDQNPRAPNCPPLDQSSKVRVRQTLEVRGPRSEVPQEQGGRLSTRRARLRKRHRRRGQGEREGRTVVVVVVVQTVEARMCQSRCAPITQRIVDARHLGSQIHGSLHIVVQAEVLP